MRITAKDAWETGLRYSIIREAQRRKVGYRRVLAHVVRVVNSYLPEGDRYVQSRKGVAK